MKLLIIRHGKAEDLPAKRDAARALTEEGRREMRKTVKGLREIVPAIDVLATSPLVRARETAEIVADIFGLSDVAEQPLLAPGADKQALIAWLRGHASDATVAVVGHEPDLSALASLAISAKAAAVLELKKGACGLIEFKTIPAAGDGTLLWLLQPGQLRRLDD